MYLIEGEFDHWINQDDKFRKDDFCLSVNYNAEIDPVDRGEHNREVSITLYKYSRDNLKKFLELGAPDLYREIMERIDDDLKIRIEHLFSRAV